MKHIVIATVNPEICKTFLDTFLFFEKNKKDYLVHVFPDERNADIKDFAFVKEYPFATLHEEKKVMTNLHEFISPCTGTEIAYTLYQTHHYKLAVLLYLFQETNLEKVFFLDDDTILLRDISFLFENEKKYVGFYMRSYLYYFHKDSQASMEEFEEFQKITKLDRSTLQESDKFIKIGQYNAGHFLFTFDREGDFLEILKDFYRNPYLKERFFENVWDLEKKQKKEVEFYNKSFFDEQKFLTFFFLSKSEDVDTVFLNKDSPVYMSYKEDEFLEDSKEDFQKKTRKNSIIHYVSKEKIQRAKKFLKLHREFNKYSLF